MLTTVLSIAAIVVGLVVLELGAERFTASLGALARQLRASESTVGLLTAGGEWEELIVVSLALWGGHTALAVGNIVGSCLANLIGSMPLGLLGRRPLVIERDARVFGGVMLGVTVLATGVLADGTVEPRWGWLLIGVFLVYVVTILLVIRRGWLRTPAEDEDDAQPARDGPVRSMAVVVAGLAVIAIGAELVVEGGVRLAREVDLSDYAIGATIIAIGTTLPDKAISLVAGLRGRGGIVTSNATGSNIFLLTLVLGLSAVGRHGLVVGRHVSHGDAPLLLGISVIVALLFLRATLHRVAGIGLLALYIGYIAFALARGA